MIGYLAALVSLGLIVAIIAWLNRLPALKLTEAEQRERDSYLQTW